MKLQNIKATKSRFHYLSFNNPKSVEILEKIGINEDSSLSFPDQAGFRTGCCFKHYMYNFTENKMSSVIQNPLIFMEDTILRNSQTFDEALIKIKSLKDTVRKHQGDFIFLWHNHRLVNAIEKEIYLEVLKS